MFHSRNSVLSGDNATKARHVTNWFIVHICGLLAPMAILVGSAWGQGGDRADVAPPSPSSQTVTLADIEGTKIHTKLVNEMLVQRQGWQGPITQDSDWQIEVRPEQTINFEFRLTAHMPRGTREAPVRGMTVKLDEPWSTDNGEAVWQFRDGELTFMRSYHGGAVRTIISLKQNGQNLTCATTAVFARERGKSGLVLNSGFDGVPVTILSWKPVSSTCDVIGKKPDMADPSKP